MDIHWPFLFSQGGKKMGQQGTLSNIQMDLADVTFNGVSLGYTKGGVEVNITQAFVDAIIDDFGDTPVKTWDKGIAIEVIVHRANLAVAFPTAVDAGDRLKFGGQAGAVISPGRLVINPVAGNLDPIVVYGARPTSDVAIPFNLDDIATIDITFVGTIVAGRADGDRLFRIGGPAS
jgi:hypothetical protein